MVDKDADGGYLGGGGIGNCVREAVDTYAVG